MAVSVAVLIRCLFAASLATTTLFAAPAVAQVRLYAEEGRAGTSSAAVGPQTVQPEYPGGDAALIAFLSQTLRYPTDAYTAGAQGRVDVSFWIDEKGRPYGFGAIESPHAALTAEALRMLRQMPAWTPGRRDGIAVPLLVHVPVVFRLPAAP